MVLANGPGRNDAKYSIGASVGRDGTIVDVLPGTPAYDAGLGPRMTILAVDGHVYSPEWLNQSIAHPGNGTIVLVVRNFDSIEIREVRYAGGIRFPHLERIPGSQDHLTQILAPRND